MILDEAIKHAEEVAKQNEEDAVIYSNCKNHKKNLYEIELAENAEKKCCKCAEEHRQLAEWLKDYKRLKEHALEWIPIVKKELTDKERAEYLAENGEELCYMLENEMPLSGQEVLVSSGEFVSEDVFNEDFYNFENHDIENVDAWMPLPKSYKTQRSEG